MLTLSEWEIVGVADNKTMRAVEIAARLVLLHVRLIVVNVRTILSSASGIQLVRAEAPTHVVNGLRVCVGETVLEAARVSASTRARIRFLCRRQRASAT